MQIFFTEAQNQKVRDDKSASPEVFGFDCGQLPFERMGDDHFELLLADIFRAQADAGAETWYDETCRVNGGADKGRDVILFLDSAPVGLVQCKRYGSTAVTLQMVAEEICKFFLNAVIDPSIAAPVGEEFSYIVAIADKVQGELVSFLQDKGKARFEKKRALFEKSAIKVRSKYEKLKENILLKSLNEKELCDLVWERIDTLKTGIYKKDNLSSLVNKYPEVKSVYFKLENDSQNVIKELNRILESCGATVASNDEKFLSEIKTEYFNRSIGNVNNFNLALIQGADAVLFLKDFLSNVDSILCSKFGSNPVLITSGAKSAQPDDWYELNYLVKEYPYPLVLFLGCGEVTGQQLNDWGKLDEIIWPDTNWIPGRDQCFNAGWCWVSDPDKNALNCYLIVENEPENIKLGSGKLVLRLAFEDAIIWPTLGNDFTLPITHPRAHIRRMIVSQSEDNKNRRNLVLNSQHIKSIETMIEPLSDYHAQRYRSKVAVVMANSDSFHDCKAKLYSATGVFPSSDLAHITRSTPITFQPESRVLRRRGNGALTATIKWNNSIEIGAIWSFHKLDENIIEDLPPVALEFDELFDRHPPLNGYVQFAQEELNQLKKLVQNQDVVDVHKFTYSARHGVKAGETFTIDDLTSNGEALMQVVHALSYIASHSASSWLVNSEDEGHITYADPLHGHYNILGLANEKVMVRDIENALYEWSMKLPAHPHLVVFAECRGTVKEKRIANNRHNFKEHPVEDRTFTEAQTPRGIYMFSLSDIESEYVDSESNSADQFMGEISSRRKHLDAK